MGQTTHLPAQTRTKTSVEIMLSKGLAPVACMKLRLELGMVEKPGEPFWWIIALSSEPITYDWVLVSLGTFSSLLGKCVGCLRVSGSARLTWHFGMCRSQVEVQATMG